jgi:hypothetical protein
MYINTTQTIKAGKFNELVGIKLIKITIESYTRIVLYI